MSVSRHSYECRLLNSFIFLPVSRDVFVCFLKTVARLSYDIRMTIIRVSRNVRIVNSRRHVRNSRMNAVRLSHDSLATYFDKNSHKLVRD